MALGVEEWVVVRTVTAVLTFLKSCLPKAKEKPSEKPKPRERAYMSGGNGLLEIENQGLTAEFRAQIVKAVNVEGWPGKARKKG